MNKTWTRFRSWNASELIIDKKSKFQARNVEIKTTEEIPNILHEFLIEHKSIQRASHPHIIAWRCATNTQGNIDQGFKDNGEKGGGSRILDILVKHDLVNILVIVTRWYGGTPIGSSRFRHITNSTLKSLRINHNL
ncbi:unnamed protein product [Candida verbasci]|uniref:Impact N-terminal domain-containing protein n=1 Tax=Candida verbasci TaxID=1227364 RepID=A0A9W4TZ42_9ASCO|nr:unnamed protein product [Candida verbasci]